MRSKLVFLIIFLFSALLFARNGAPLQSGEKMNLSDAPTSQGLYPLCGTILINDELVRTALENTRLHNPEVYSAMLEAQQFGLNKTTEYQIGELKKFFVLNLQTNQFDEVTAKLLASGNLTQVWVDTTELNNEHVTQSEVDAIFNALENQTPAESRDPNKGIVAIDQQYFGQPPNKDGDGKSDFLLVDIQDGWEPGKSYVAGFFTSWDQTDNTGSNQRDMLYIDTYPGIYNNGTRNPYAPLSVLAHEYQHLIHYNYDQHEETVINEGLSEVAEVLCGYPLRSPSRYLNNPDVPLFDWDNYSGDVLADYSRAALFTLYYDEQLGDDFLKELVAAKIGNSPLRGISAFNQVMSDRGVGYDFNELFKNFVLANYLNDRDIDPHYGYQYPLSLSPNAVYYHTDPKQDINNESIYAYAVDYIVFQYGDSLQITFESPVSSIQVYALKYGNTTTEVEQVPVYPTGATDQPPYVIPEFGSTVNTVVFAVVNLSQVNGYYSYHSIGKEQAFFVEHKYDDGSPDPFSGSATFLGFGDNKIGSGWAVKFEPEIPSNQLVSASIMAAFSQEFSGSNVPADAPKDFEFHIWEDNNGTPGNDLIPPFIVSTDRASFNREFLNIDLSQYSEQLTNIGTVYVGFLENDTIGTYVGMDNSTPTNFTFGYSQFSGEWQWVPMENLKVGSTPLAGWNMMMRAVFSYSDTTQPVFTVGYFQNPIFSEQLDIFVVGSSRLSPDRLIATMLFNGTLDTLQLHGVPNTAEQVLTDNNVTLTSSGELQIRVFGTNKYGTKQEDTTFVFNVQFMESRYGGKIASASRRLQLDIPAEALSRDMYLIASDHPAEVLNPALQALAGRVSPIYTISPAGTRLDKAAVLQIQLDRSQFSPEARDELAIAYWKEDHWTILPSQWSQDGTALVANISQLGHFTVVNQSLVSVGTESDRELPREFALLQNYPNPFNPATTIVYTLPEASQVVLSIYDVLGREIKTLVNNTLPAGRYQVTWDGTDQGGRPVSSGIYIYRLRAGHFTKTMKMLLTR